MNSLPSELLMLIASNLNDYDLHRFRLVSRSFASAGIQHLHVKKYFFLRKHSLRRLHSVARHPVLRRNLTEIVFFVDIVPAYQSQEAWEPQARATCHTSKSGGRDQLANRWLQKHKFYEVVPLQELRRDDGDDDDNNYFRKSGWHIQQKIRQEQEELLDPSSTTFDELQENLSLLPNLRSFSLNTFQQYHWPIMRHLFVLDNNQDWYCCNYTCALESFRQVTRRLLHAALAGRRTTNRCPQNNLRTLGTYITAFVDTDDRTYDISPWAERLKHLHTLNVLSVLDDRLDPRLPSHDNSRNPDGLHRHVTGEDGQGKMETFLRQIMLNVADLQSLSLNVATGWGLRTQPMFLGVKLSHLNYLSLTFVKIAVSSFKTFLSSHASSLKTLQLLNATLITTTLQTHLWIDLFKFMSHSLHLSDVRFGTLLYKDHLGFIIFDRRVTHRLGSGLTISTQDLVRFLICDRFPVALDDPLHPDREEFKSLDWSVLTTGHS